MCQVSVQEIFIEQCWTSLNFRDLVDDLLFLFTSDVVGDALAAGVHVENSVSLKNWNNTELVLRLHTDISQDKQPVFYTDSNAFQVNNSRPPLLKMTHNPPPLPLPPIRGIPASLAPCLKKRE